MRVIIRDDAVKMADYAAEYIKNRIVEFNPTSERPFVLGLATGSTPLPIYKRLIEYYKKGELSFEHVVTFNLDSYVGLPVEHPASYHSEMYKNLFSHVNINPANVHIPDGMAKDLVAECNRYEECINAHGGVELWITGVGTDGHIAFNEPGSSLSSRTRIKTLAYETIVANARFFEGDINKVPKMALTTGVGTILDAREIICLVNGMNKADALMKCIEQGVNHMYTMSALQMHKNALIVCDEEATLDCRVRTIKYFKGLEKTMSEFQQASL